MKPSKSQANRFKSKFLASKSITMALVPVVGNIFIQDLRSICKYYNQDLSPKVLQLDVILHSLPNYDEILNDVTEAAKELVWLRKFFTSIGVVPGMEKLLVLLCDNNGAIANSKEPRSHKRSKHIERKYHIIREYVARGDVLVEKVDTEDNLADPFTKVLAVTAFEKHRQNSGLIYMY
ncbi:hypothetical protein CsatA_004568 [Cannabis sativa]